MSTLPLDVRYIDVECDWVETVCAAVTRPLRDPGLYGSSFFVCFLFCLLCSFRFANILFHFLIPQSKLRVQGENIYVRHSNLMLEVGMAITTNETPLGSCRRLPCTLRLCLEALHGLHVVRGCMPDPCTWVPAERSPLGLEHQSGDRLWEWAGPAGRMECIRRISSSFFIRLV